MQAVTRPRLRGNGLCEFYFMGWKQPCRFCSQPNFSAASSVIAPGASPCPGSRNAWRFAEWRCSAGGKLHGLRWGDALQYSPCCELEGWFVTPAKAACCKRRDLVPFYLC